jgi:hypothetical protein
MTTEFIIEILPDQVITDEDKKSEPELPFQYTICSLPNDIIRKIGEYLDTNSRLNFSIANKAHLFVFEKFRREKLKLAPSKLKEEKKSIQNTKVIMANNLENMVQENNSPEVCLKIFLASNLHACFSCTCIGFTLVLGAFTLFEEIFDAMKGSPLDKNLLFGSVGTIGALAIICICFVNANLFQRIKNTKTLGDEIENLSGHEKYVEKIIKDMEEGYSKEKTGDVENISNNTSLPPEEEGKKVHSYFFAEPEPEAEPDEEEPLLKEKRYSKYGIN